MIYGTSQRQQVRIIGWCLPAMARGVANAKANQRNKHAISLQPSSPYIGRDAYIAASSMTYQLHATNTWQYVVHSNEREMPVIRHQYIYATYIS